MFIEFVWDYASSYCSTSSLHRFTTTKSAPFGAINWIFYGEFQEFITWIYFLYSFLKTISGKMIPKYEVSTINLTIFYSMKICSFSTKISTNESVEIAKARVKCWNLPSPFRSKDMNEWTKFSFILQMNLKYKKWNICLGVRLFQWEQEK